jgi:hypothetical protein
MNSLTVIWVLARTTWMFSSTPTTRIHFIFSEWRISELLVTMSPLCCRLEKMAMLKCMSMYCTPASVYTYLQFILKRRWWQSLARLIGPFYSLDSLTMKATTRCFLQVGIGHLDLLQPLWPHPQSPYPSPLICQVFNHPFSILWSLNAQMV